MLSYKKTGACSGDERYVLFSIGLQDKNVLMIGG